VPTYEYACTECGDRIEVVQRFTDDPLTVCTACGGKLRKLFSAVGIVFKGSGFYRTDSRNASTVKSANGSGGSGSSDGGSSGSDKGGKAPASSSSSGDSAGSKTGSSSAGGDKKAAVGA
jgi:putative FmdB family regulatory protein